MRRRTVLTRQDDQGFAVTFTVGVTIALISLVGIVLDGGLWIRTQSEVFGVAASAARAGAQQLDEDAVLNGEFGLDETAAQQAAMDYLAARGLTGQVQVDGLEVTVTAQGTVDFKILPMQAVTVEETATARATQERATP